MLIFNRGDSKQIETVKKSKSVERTEPVSVTPKQNNKLVNFFKNGNPDNQNNRKESVPAVQRKIEEKRVLKNPLHDYLTEDSINPPDDELKDKGQQLEVMEQNLKQIQGKCFLPPNLKHFRYPSFGRGGLEKDGKLSTRRATSQESYSPKAPDSKSKEKPKEQASKSFTEAKNAKPQIKSSNTVPTEGPETDVTINNTISNTTINKSKVETKEPGQTKKKNSIARQEPKIAYSSLMKSLEMRKSLIQANTEEKKNPWEGKRQYNTLDLNHNFFAVKEPLIQSIYSSGVTESPNKKVVDIYERNSRWMTGKDERIKNLASLKSKEEMQACTFKPQRRQTGSSEKIRDELEIQKAFSEKSRSPNPRNISQERKAVNSYKGIHQMKKGVISSQSSPFSSPKSKFYSEKI